MTYESRFGAGDIPEHLEYPAAADSLGYGTDDFGYDGVVADSDEIDVDDDAFVAPERLVEGADVTAEAADTQPDTYEASTTTVMGRHAKFVDRAQGEGWSVESVDLEAHEPDGKVSIRVEVTQEGEDEPVTRTYVGKVGADGTTTNHEYYKDADGNTRKREYDPKALVDGLPAFQGSMPNRVYQRLLHDRAVQERTTREQTERDLRIEHPLATPAETDELANRLAEAGPARVPVDALVRTAQMRKVPVLDSFARKPLIDRLVLRGRDELSYDPKAPVSDSDSARGATEFTGYVRDFSPDPEAGWVFRDNAWEFEEITDNLSAGVSSIVRVRVGEAPNPATGESAPFTRVHIEQTGPLSQLVPRDPRGAAVVAKLGGDTIAKQHVALDYTVEDGKLWTGVGRGYTTMGGEDIPLPATRPEFYYTRLRGDELEARQCRNFLEAPGAAQPRRQ